MQLDIVVVQFVAVVVVAAIEVAPVERVAVQQQDDVLIIKMKNVVENYFFRFNFK